MGIKHRFDPERAVEAILYITERAPNMYSVLKVLYFADKMHLSRYGRLICGDSYFAMDHGPVPSGAYDLIKYARGDGYWLLCEPAAEAMSLKGNTIIPHRAANTDLLSKSEIQCLDEAIDRYGHLSFGRLKALSHDAAYEAFEQLAEIPLEAIVKTLPNGELLLDYLHSI